MGVAVVELRHGPLHARVLPALGGALGSFDIERAGSRQNLLRPAPDDADDPLQTACFPMAPFCGRIHADGFVFGGHRVQLPPMPPSTTTPLHGLVWRAPWQIVARDPAKVEIRCAYPGSHWPWPFVASQTFELDERGLAIELSLRNTGPGPMPCGLGLHPYFPCAAGTRLNARVARRLRHDAAQIACGHEAAADFLHQPVHGLGLDHSYDGWDGQLLVEDAAGPRLRLRATTPLTRLHLYTPTGEGFFCAEPMSHQVNALTLDEPAALAAGLQVLAPGASTRLCVRFELP